MGYPIIGERIAYRRKQLGMTLDDIAQEVGVARSTIQRYEKGTIDSVKLPVIEAIARIISVNPAWICGKTDDMELEKPSVPEVRWKMDGIRVHIPPEYREISILTGKAADGTITDAEWQRLIELQSNQPPIKYQMDKLKDTLDRMAKAFPADDKLEWALSRLNNAGKNKVADYALDLTQIPDYQAEQPPAPDSDTATAEKPTEGNQSVER